MNTNFMIIGALALLVVIVLIIVVVVKNKKHATTYPMTTYPMTTYPMTTYPMTTYPMTTQTPKKNYLVYNGYYLTMNNKSLINVTPNITEATPISIAPYSVSGTEYLTLKTADGQNFISANKTAVGSESIEYTNTVILNYEPAGRNGTFSTLYISKIDDMYVMSGLGTGFYFVIGLGGTRYGSTTISSAAQFKLVSI
jgi:hypothetical protein